MPGSINSIAPNLQAQILLVSAEAAANPNSAKTKADEAALNQQINSSLSTNTTMSKQAIQLLTQYDQALTDSINGIPGPSIADATTQLADGLDELTNSVSEFSEAYKCVTELITEDEEMNPNAVMEQLAIVEIDLGGQQTEQAQEAAASTSKEIIVTANDEYAEEMTEAKDKLTADLITAGSSIAEGTVQGVNSAKGMKGTKESFDEENTVATQKEGFENTQKASQKMLDGAENEVSVNSNEIDTQQAKLQANHEERTQLQKDEDAEKTKYSQGDPAPGTEEGEKLVSSRKNREKRRDELNDEDVKATSSIKDLRKTGLALKEKLTAENTRHADVKNSTDKDIRQNAKALDELKHQDEIRKMKSEAVRALTPVISAVGNTVAAVFNQKAAQDKANADMYGADINWLNANLSFQNTTADGWKSLVDAGQQMLGAVRDSIVGTYQHDWNNI